MEIIWLIRLLFLLSFGRIATPFILSSSATTILAKSHWTLCLFAEVATLSPFPNTLPYTMLNQCTQSALPLSNIVWGAGGGRVRFRKMSRFPCWKRSDGENIAFFHSVQHTFGQDCSSLSSFATAELCAGGLLAAASALVSAAVSACKSVRETQNLSMIKSMEQTFCFCPSDSALYALSFTQIPETKITSQGSKYVGCDCPGESSLQEDCCCCWWLTFRLPDR